ncbi:hypothetical protein [Kingella potus]|nr:hypothetical protein [Kingella potus]UOP00377.1 hypothetical protein LVJ84_10855 [Kingella potus]
MEYTDTAVGRILESDSRPKRQGSLKPERPSEKAKTVANQFPLPRAGEG